MSSGERIRTLDAPLQGARAALELDWKLIVADQLPRRSLFVRRGSDDEVPVDQLSAEQVELRKRLENALWAQGGVRLAYAASAGDDRLDVTVRASAAVFEQALVSADSLCAGKVEAAGRRVQLVLAAASDAGLPGTWDVEVRTSDPAAALVFELSTQGAPPPEDRTSFAVSAPLSRVPLPRLPDPRDEPWEEAKDGDDWTVDVARGAGWLELSVDGRAEEVGARVRVYAVRHPPKAGAERIPFEAAPGLRALSAEALPDALVLEGRLPLRARIRPAPNTRLALAVEVSGRMVAAENMRYLGRRFCKDSLDLVLPAWLPQRMDWFVPELEPALESGAGAPLSRTIRLERTDPAPVMEGALGLTADDARFLRRIGRRE